MGAKSLGFSGPSSANFQSILDCFVPDFDSENIKADLVNTVVFNLHHIKLGAFFFGGGGGGHPVQKEIKLHFYTRFAKVLA